MPLENASYVAGLDASNPPGTDGLAQVDDHLRLLKSVLKASFPKIDSAVTVTPAILNGMDDRVKAIEARPVLADGLFIGEYKVLAHNTVPSKWLPCDGREVSRTTYSALFALIGEAYGKGNEITTFNIPDFRGRAIAGGDMMGGSANANRMAGTWTGWAGGSAVHTLTVNEIPAHNHPAWSDAQGTHSHSGWTDAQGSHNHGARSDGAGAHQHTFPRMTGIGVVAGGSPAYAGPGWEDALTGWTGEHTHVIHVDHGGVHSHNVGTHDAGNHAHNIGTGNTGLGHGHNNIQPTLCANVIIYAGV